MTEEFIRFMLTPIAIGEENSTKDPLYRMFKDKDGIKVRVWVPGFGKDDLTVNVDESDNLLIILGKVDDQFHVGSFELKLSIPLAKLDWKNMEVLTGKGILLVNIPWKKKTFHSISIKG